MFDCKGLKNSLFVLLGASCNVWDEESLQACRHLLCRYWNCSNDYSGMTKFRYFLNISLAFPAKMAFSNMPKIVLPDPDIDVYNAPAS